MSNSSFKKCFRSPYDFAHEKVNTNYFESTLLDKNRELFSSLNEKLKYYNVRCSCISSIDMITRNLLDSLNIIAFQNDDTQFMRIIQRLMRLKYEYNNSSLPTQQKQENEERQRNFMWACKKPGLNPYTSGLY